MSASFGKLLRRLADAKVEFILVGGLAANARGSARVTTDVDVSYGRSVANLERLVKALTPIKPYLRGAPPGWIYKHRATLVADGVISINGGTILRERTSDRDDWVENDAVFELDLINQVWA